LLSQFCFPVVFAVGFILFAGSIYLYRVSGRHQQPEKTTTITEQLPLSVKTAATEKMGFTKTVIRPGNGQKPRRGQEVTVHCTGYGKNRDLSQKFWSTKDPGQKPFTFAVGTGSVIKGWDESVIDMSIGEIAKIHCSPDYAYGAGGFATWGIMPNSELVFEIEVLSYS